MNRRQDDAAPNRRGAKDGARMGSQITTMCCRRDQRVCGARIFTDDLATLFAPIMKAFEAIQLKQIDKRKFAKLRARLMMSRSLAPGLYDEGRLAARTAPREASSNRLPVQTARDDLARASPAASSSVCCPRRCPIPGNRLISQRSQGRVVLSDHAPRATASVRTRS